MSRMSATDPQRTAPVACSLDAAGLQSQGQRWLRIVRDAGIDRAATTDGVALTFRPDPHVERELRALVAIENECCAWARWEVQADTDGWLVMHAGTSGDGIAVLQSMFATGE